MEFIFEKKLKPIFEQNLNKSLHGQDVFSYMFSLESKLIFLDEGNCSTTNKHQLKKS